MTRKPNTPHRSQILICSLFALILSLGSLFAQSDSTGTVTGRVFDERTGQSLEGAIVRVVGTNVIDYTTTDGRFSVSAPAGSTTIQVEYVGLDPITRPVQVSAGGTTTLNAGLTSNILQLDSFVVQESVRGQSLAINMQKIASGIVNIVSEETFGQMPAGNIGSALQRLPGISVNEDKDGSATGINIRGIAGDYNSFQIDGNRAPNPGGTSRSFNSNQFMADGVTNIEVIKAPTPDRDGDAIGGIINVVSRSAFQREGRDVRLKVAGVYSALPKKWGHEASLQYSDIFSVGGGEKNLGISLTASSYKTNRYSINADQDFVQVTPENNPQLNLDQYGDYAVWFFESTHFEYQTRITNTYGLSGSIDFRTDENNSFYLRPVYSHFDRQGITFETDIDIDTRFQDQVGGRKTYAELTHDYGRASAASEGSRGWIGTDDDQGNDIYSLAFGGRHEKGDSLITYDLHYSYSKNLVENDTELNMLMEPDDPWIIQEYKIHDISKGLVEVNVLNGVDISDLSLMTEGELEVVNSVKEEDIYGGRFDWEKKFTGDQSAFTFKTGVKYRMSKPQFDRTTLAYEMDEDFPYAQVLEVNNDEIMMKQKYYDVYPRRGQALLASNPELFEFDEDGSLNNSNLADYSAEESTSAVYAMGTYRRGRHTVIGGARFESNEWSAERKSVNLITDSVDSRNIGAKYDFVLPGLHLRHELRKNLILRESFNQSYGRPNLGQLTRGRTYALNGNITDGNVNLKPAFSNNFDVQLEYYTANSGLYSIGVFYKDVENFTYTETSQFDVVDANGDPIIVPNGAETYSVPRNGSTGKNTGLELIARQRLTFLPGFFKGLTASASATFTESEATIPNRTDRDDLTLPGFSDYIFTSSLEYARGRFRIRADYRYRSDYVEGLGSDIESDEYYAAEERVDAEISYELRRGLSLYASGTNLTERYQVSYQGFGQNVEDTSFAGRKFTVGMEYKF